MGKFLAVASFHNNPDEHIDLTFQNMLDQTHQDWLLIVGDDFSEDEEFKRRLKKKVETLNDNRIIYYQTKERRELYLYQNMFLQYQYDYYFDLDSDDKLHPMLFEIYDKHFNEHPNVMSIFSDYHQYTGDGNLEQWSLVQEPADWGSEWLFRHHSEFWQKYSNRNTQKMFGAGRCMRRPDVNAIPIVESCKTATDTFFLFYNLTRGEHLHIPRNLYSYYRREGSDSGRMTIEEHEAFNKNALPFQEQYDKNKVEDNVGYYSDVWHLTSAISTCEWLDDVDTFAVWAEVITNEQKKKITSLYPDKTILFNDQHENLILAWTMSNPQLDKIDLGEYKRLSVLTFKDADGDITTHEQLNEHTDKVKADIESIAPGGTWYYFFRQNRYTLIRNVNEHRPKCTFRYRTGPDLRVQWSPNDKDYTAQFWVGDTLKWERVICTGFWARYSEDWFQDWRCVITYKGKALYELKPDLRVFGVQLDSASLGDTLSWMGQVEEMSQQRDYDKIIVRCHKDFLFDKKYYESIGIYFIGWNENLPDNYQNCGVYQNDEDVSPRTKHPRDWRTIPLGAIAADQLGIRFQERRPRLSKEFYKAKDLKKQSVCIATESTAAAKYWNREGGWQSLVNMFRKKGWDIYYVSKEETDLRGVTHIEDLIEAAQYMNAAGYFVGISSGLSWLAWALGVKVCMISGFTWDFVEFKCDVRIINHNVCSGCWSYTVFDRGDWNWCPQHKGTEKQFECTKTISPEFVWQELETAGWFNI